MMSKVYQIDNHDEAYQIWMDNGIHNAVLFHIDAHKDFITEKCEYITIGNFLNYAWDKGLINTIVWIIPTPSFLCANILAQLIEEMEVNFTLVDQSKRMLKFVMNSHRVNEVIITTMPNISFVEESLSSDIPVLVDIDIDYFVNPYVHRTYSNDYPNSFWTKSESVYQAIQSLVSKCDLITIAKSIYGGYTPLLFSFISDQLYAMLVNQTDYIQEYVYLEKAIELLNMHNYIEASKLFEKVIHYPNCYLSAITGLLYSNLFSGRTDKVRKYYSDLLTGYPQYEPYFFPVHPMLKSDHFVQAEQLIDSWLHISPESNQANLYKVKVFSCSSCYFKMGYQLYLDKIDDEETKSEKSYVMADYYLKLHLYNESIECCEKVLAYLKNNDSPLWVGQISSYESRKNHGNILAFLFEKMAIAYYKSGDFKCAQKYALMCKKIGYKNQNPQAIINTVLEKRTS
ncbi:hypothetical protein HQN87_03530 [Paenibacillus tritici]|uniref:Tetratricopeptide repeat protein n=1 Tax=Paenibacillus tritici TaxID=1873425 RepID=A0ABX2DIE8_9BACL|nr:hypothetical protein [Paenibacillus tritici]NQX44394.1 hypothetical protein [Paenibacillus tritici]